MIIASFLIKSGTCGWFDYDGCDMCLKKIKRDDNQFVIPPVGSKVVINTKGECANKYIVNDIEIFYGDYNDEDFNNTYINIYVLEYSVKKHAGEETDKLRQRQWNKT